MILGQFEKKQEQKEILPQVDHKSPIFDRMHVKKEDIKCGCLQARTFLFHNYVWTEKEIRRDGWQVFCGNRIKDHCSLISGLLEQQAVPNCQEAQIIFLCLRIAFFPHPSWSTSSYSISTAVFLIFRTGYACIPRARWSFTDHSELLDKDMLASSVGYLIFHS